MNPTVKYRALVYLLLTVVLALNTTPAFARGYLNAYTAADEDIRQYLQQKYQVVDLEINSSDDNLYGSRRSLFLSGDLTPPSAAGLDSKDARGIAQAFLREERDFLGLTPDIELRERIKTSPRMPGTEDTGTSLAYYHYIHGVKLALGWTTLHVSKEGKIVSVSVDLVPLSTEMLDAAKKPRLDKQAVHRLVKEDPSGVKFKDNPNAKTMHAHTIESTELLIPNPPYVIWEVHPTGQWDYVVDGFSGKILRKLNLVDY